MKAQRAFLRALAVAGLSMTSIFLSEFVPSGAEPGTRQILFWSSAALALLALVTAWPVFFASAWNALRHGRTNMDVPIAIGILLAFALSACDTFQKDTEADFVAATSLLLVLVIGRALEHRLRQQVRQTVTSLADLAPRGATVLRNDGSCVYLPLAEIEPGMTLVVAAGDRIPVDGVVASGASQIDGSIVSGDCTPQPVSIDSPVKSGMLNMTAAFTMVAIARSADSFLAGLVRWMEVAEGGRARYRRFTARAGQVYPPIIQAIALLSYAGWFVVNGDWRQSLTIAIAVLIISSPCAVVLAAPFVRAVAARRLFESGIMVKDGSALERMAAIDSVAFDKTGTLTLGRPQLEDGDQIDPRAAAIAAALAGTSSHPVARAIVEHFGRHPSALTFKHVEEVDGQGIEAVAGNGSVYRLGRAGWAALTDVSDGAGTVLGQDGKVLARFQFRDDLRPGAREAVDALRQQGFEALMLSGDQLPAVAQVAADVGIGDYAAGMLPGDKLARIEGLARDGHRTLMVGNGVYDARVLAAAHVSMAPATPADINRKAADFVFLRPGLGAVPLALSVSKEAARRIRQNIGMAVLYNLVALPLAIAGFLTPISAALLMSLSSSIVVANALRLRAGRANGGMCAVRSSEASDAAKSAAAGASCSGCCSIR
jgi:Cu2+-exporting ATPase